MALGKLAVVIGAGIVGSILTKEGHFSDVTNLFSGAFKIVTNHLKQDKGNSQSSSKAQTDSLLAQVNTLRQELQLLASSRSVTIVTGARSGSGTYGITAVIVLGAVGYVCIRWKGWKLSDMMFVTRRGLSDACITVGKQLEIVSASIAAAKCHISKRIDHVDTSLEECKELATATKCEVSELHGDLSLFHTEVQSVHRAVQTLETKLGQIEDRQDFATRGVYHLCQFVERFEQNRSAEVIQDSPSNSRRAIELPQATLIVTRACSLPPLPLETPSSTSSLPSSSLSPSAVESSNVLRPSTAVSTSGLKELQEISNAIKAGSSGSSFKTAGFSEILNESPVNEQPSSSAQPSRSGWRFPGIRILTRTRSTVT